MDTQDIMVELNRFIREKYKIAENDADFGNNVHLFDFGYIDSFGAVDLISFVETRFNIKISEADLVVYPLNTIQEIALFIEKRTIGEV